MSLQDPRIPRPDVHARTEPPIQNAGSPAFPTTLPALTFKLTNVLSAPVDSPTKQEIMEIANKKAAIERAEAKLASHEREVQEVRDRLAAKASNLEERKRRLLAAKKALAEQQKRTRESLQKKIEQDDKGLKIDEAQMAAAARRVEIGKKRKQENEELLAELGFEMEVG